MLSSPASANETGFLVGAGSYAFRWHVDLLRLSPQGLIESAAQMGAQVVQLCDNLPLGRPSAGDLRELARFAGAYGVRLEYGIKGTQPEKLCEGLAAAAALGSPVLRAVIADGAWKPGPDELVQILRQVLPELRGAGVALALENHFDLRPAELAQVVEAVGDPYVGVCLDPLNGIPQLADPEETIRLLAPYALTVHVKDARPTRRGTGFYFAGCRAGEGMLNVPGLVAALAAAGRFPALLLEFWMDRLDDDAATCAQEASWIRDGIQYLKNVSSG